jgi:hypothetical protein
VRFFAALWLFWWLSRKYGALVEEGGIYKVGDPGWHALIAIAAACFIVTEFLYFFSRMGWRATVSYIREQKRATLIVPESEKYARTVWQAMKDHPIPLLIGITCLLAGHAFSHNEIVQELFRDTGIAFVVAFIIIITIEQKSRRELNERIQQFMQLSHQYLFKSVFGVDLPQRMYDLVQERILKEPFYRFGTQVNYDLRPLTDQASTRFGARRLLLDVDFSYTVKNLSDREQPYAVKFFVENNFPMRTGADRVPAVPQPRVSINGVPLTEAELRAADAQWFNTPGMTRYIHEISLARGATAHIKVEHTLDKLIADSETWRSIYPCDGLNVSISYPDELTVEVDGIHRSDLVTIHKSPVSYRGEIREPLFPANGIVFWWHPRQPGERDEPDPRQAVDSRTTPSATIDPRREQGTVLTVRPPPAESPPPDRPSGDERTS